VGDQRGKCSPLGVKVPLGINVSPGSNSRSKIGLSRYIENSRKEFLRNEGFENSQIDNCAKIVLPNICMYIHMYIVPEELQPGMPDFS
jgi:hypothetical protein